MLDSQLELEFSPDKSTAGYRLHELSVLNWGTFHNKAYVMRPEGRTAMITGRNGSGKSTIVDALLTLLVPNRVRNYNVASSHDHRISYNLASSHCDHHRDGHYYGHRDDHCYSHHYRDGDHYHVYDDVRRLSEK